MEAPPQPQTDPSGRFLALLFMAVMGGFILTSVIVQRTSFEVAALSQTIASTSSASVERLAMLWSAVSQVERARAGVRYRSGAR